MTRTVPVIALAGLCTAAHAASVTLNFSANASELNIGDTITWTVSASFNGVEPSGYFGGFVGSFVALDPRFGVVTETRNFMQGQGVEPTVDGPTINTVNVFNSALLGTDDQANPFIFYEFDVLLDDYERGAGLGYDAVGTASLFNSDFIFEVPIEFTDFEVNSDVVRLIPSPGVAAALAVGLIASGRRRG